MAVDAKQLKLYYDGDPLDLSKAKSLNMFGGSVDELWINYNGSKKLIYSRAGSYYGITDLVVYANVGEVNFTPLYTSDKISYIQDNDDYYDIVIPASGGTIKGISFDYLFHYVENGLEPILGSGTLVKDSKYFSLLELIHVDEISVPSLEMTETSTNTVIRIIGPVSFAIGTSAFGNGSVSAGTSKSIRIVQSKNIMKTTTTTSSWKGTVLYNNVEYFTNDSELTVVPVSYSVSAAMSAYSVARTLLSYSYTSHYDRPSDDPINTYGYDVLVSSGGTWCTYDSVRGVLNVKNSTSGNPRSAIIIFKWNDELKLLKLTLERNPNYEPEVYDLFTITGIYRQNGDPLTLSADADELYNIRVEYTYYDKNNVFTSGYEETFLDNKITVSLLTSTLAESVYQIHPSILLNNGLETGEFKIKRAACTAEYKGPVIYFKDGSKEYSTKSTSTITIPASGGSITVTGAKDWTKLSSNYDIMTTIDNPTYVVDTSHNMKWSSSTKVASYDKMTTESSGNSSTILVTHNSKTGTLTINLQANEYKSITWNDPTYTVITSDVKASGWDSSLLPTITSFTYTLTGKATYTSGEVSVSRNSDTNPMKSYTYTSFDWSENGDREPSSLTVTPCSRALKGHGYANITLLDNSIIQDVEIPIYLEANILTLNSVLLTVKNSSGLTALSVGAAGGTLTITPTITFDYTSGLQKANNSVPTDATIVWSTISGSLGTLDTSNGTVTFNANSGTGSRVVKCEITYNGVTKYSSVELSLTDAGSETLSSVVCRMDVYLPNGTKYTGSSKSIPASGEWYVLLYADAIYSVRGGSDKTYSNVSATFTVKDSNGNSITNTGTWSNNKFTFSNLGTSPLDARYFYFYATYGGITSSKDPYLSLTSNSINTTKDSYDNINVHFDYSISGSITASGGSAKLNVSSIYISADVVHTWSSGLTSTELGLTYSTNYTYDIYSLTFTNTSGSSSNISRFSIVDGEIIHTTMNLDEGTDKAVIRVRATNTAASSWYKDITLSATNSKYEQIQSPKIHEFSVKLIPASGGLRLIPTAEGKITTDINSDNTTLVYSLSKTVTYDSGATSPTTSVSPTWLFKWYGGTGNVTIASRGLNVDSANTDTGYTMSVDVIGYDNMTTRATAKIYQELNVKISGPTYTNRSVRGLVLSTAGAGGSGDVEFNCSSSKIAANGGSVFIRLREDYKVTNVFTSGTYNLTITNAVIPASNFTISKTLSYSDANYVTFGNADNEVKTVTFEKNTGAERGVDIEYFCSYNSYLYDNSSNPFSIKQEKGTSSTPTGPTVTGTYTSVDAYGVYHGVTITTNSASTLYVYLVQTSSVEENATATYTRRGDFSSSSSITFDALPASTYSYYWCSSDLGSTASSLPTGSSGKITFSQA